MPIIVMMTIPTSRVGAMSLLNRVAAALLLAYGAPIGAVEVSGIKSGAELARAVTAQVATIDSATLQREIAQNPELVLIDVRLPGEIMAQGGQIKATQNVNIPRGWLEFRVMRHTPSKDTPIVVYCGGNIRSVLAAHTLQQMGYTQVRNYVDGFLGWKAQNLPIDPP